MVDKIIENALSTLGVPVQRVMFKSQQKPPAFIIWQYITSQPSNYADDDNETTDHTLRVHIYAKQNYTTLLESTVAALKKAGCTIASIDSEIYEEETGFFHRPITIYFLEEQQCN